VDAMTSPKTVAEALAFATRYWDTNERTSSRGPNMMPIRADRCASILGRSKRLSALGPSDGTRLLGELRRAGLARSSVASYYAAGRRMLGLSGVSTVAWPKAPTAPRKLRPPVEEPRVRSLIADLEERGWPETARLVAFLWDTGCRVDVEALRGEKELHGELLRVVGKQGHERMIPYAGTAAEATFCGLTYEGHLRRIKVTGTDIRPHDLRRAFVKRAYEGSGKDIRVAQVLAGHSDPGTTAGYIGVSEAELRGALQCKEELSDALR
jgi:integrase